MKEDKIEKIIGISAIIIGIVMCIGIIIFAIEFAEMLNDHRCYNLPLNEFYKDKKCEKYWRNR